MLDRAVLPGAVAHQSMPEHVAAIDIALLTADAESDFHYSPLKLREYLAVGKPVVAARVGQVMSDLIDGLHVEMYDAGDVASLASAMVRLATDRGYRERLASAGHEWEATENQIEPQLERVIAVAARRARVRR